LASLPDQTLLAERAATLVATDERGRLTGSGPHLYILRTLETVICRCHADLPDAAARSLGDLANRPRGRPSQWAREYADYLAVLTDVAPVKSVRAGPLYSFPDRPVFQSAAVVIHKENADLLRGGLDEWRPDVSAGLPMLAMVVGGKAVSICASAHASGVAHTAGVETLPGYRGRGFASATVAAWAQLVREQGATPFYATTFDNLASQGVAKQLDLRLLGSEFSVECEIARLTP
jgi:GNAT superfamily N-acetyltransferase